MLNTEIFNKIISREIPANIIYENEKVCAFLDAHPCSPGHTLVIPKKYSKNLLDIEEEDLCAVIKAVKFLAPKIIKAVGAEGFNLHQNNEAVAGQVVMHTHFHIIPRFNNDGFTHWQGPAELEKNIENIAKKIISEIN